MNNNKSGVSKILLIIISIIIPSIIIFSIKVYPKYNNDKFDYTSLVFLILTSIVYLLIIFLLTPILDLNEELKIVIKYKDTLKSLDELQKLINDMNLKILFINFKAFINSLRSINISNEYGEIQKKYYATTETSYFFNEDNLIFSRIKSKTLNHFIQSLTGIGIFGTFYGIVQGVSSINSTDSEAIKKGINTLLSGVGVSFNSSLYGILLSLIVTGIYKLIVDMTNKNINDFIRLINSIVIPYREESGFKSIEDELKKQTSIDEKLASDLAEQLGEKFNESIESNLNKVSNNMSELVKQIEESFLNNMNKSSDNLTQELSKLLLPSLDKLQETLTKTLEIQENSTTKFLEDSMNSIKNTVNSGINNEITRLKESMDVISNQNSNLIASFSGIVDDMKELTNKQALLISSSTESVESVNNTTLNMKEVQSGLLNILDKFKGYNEMSDNNLQTIRDLSDHLREDVKRQFEINIGINDMLNKSNELSDKQNSYIVELEKLSDSFYSNIKESHKNIGELTNNMREYKDVFVEINSSSKNMLEMLDVKYTDIGEGLNKVNNQLISAIDDVNIKIIQENNKLCNSFNNIVLKLEKFQDNTNLLCNKFGKFSEVEESTMNLWSNYKESFDLLNSNINEGIKNYNDNIYQGVKQLLIEYDKSISEAISSLRNLLDNLNETTERMMECLEEYNETLSDNNKNKEDDVSV